MRKLFIQRPLWPFNIYRTYFRNANLIFSTQWLQLYPGGDIAKKQLQAFKGKVH
jgi:hypothetical protein